MEDNNGASPSADSFDIREVALGVTYPPVLDEFGTSHFPWQACELTITPTDGPSARCDVAMISPSGQMRYRRLLVGTEGAVMLAKCMLGLTLNRNATDRPKAVAKFHTELYSMGIMQFPFEDLSQHHVLREYLSEVKMYIPDDSPELPRIRGVS